MTEEIPGVTRVTREEWEALIKRYIPQIDCQFIEDKDEKTVKAKIRAYIDKPPYGLRSGVEMTFTEEALRYTTAEITEYNISTVLAHIFEHLARELRKVPAPLSGSYEIPNEP